MSKEYHLLIDSFLEGALNPNEHELFLKRMSTDTEFEEYVNFEKQLRETLNPNDWSFETNTKHPEVTSFTTLFSDSKTKALETTLKNIATQKSSVNKWKKPLLIGIAALLVISISLFSLLDSNDSPQQLYVTYFDVTELPSLVVRGDSQSDNYNVLQKVFEEKKFEKTLLFIKDSLSDISKNKGTVKLIQAISYVETAQYNKGVDSYNNLINSDLVDAQKGYWYKALLYLKKEDIKNCKKVLAEIIENNFYNSKKAKQLLKEIS